MFLPFICLKWMLKLFWGIFGWIFIILGLCLDDGRFWLEEEATHDGKNKVLDEEKENLQMFLRDMQVL